MTPMKDRLMAGAGTVLFLAAVQTNAHPTMWQIALVALGMYEVLLFAAAMGRDAAAESRKKKAQRLRRADAQRWAETWLKWPMEEV